MIGKTTIGSSFGGCVRYQFEGHKNSEEQKRAEILTAVGVRDGSPAQMIADFNRGRQLNPDLGKAVWHTSISFNPDDAAKLTSEKMLAVAQDYLQGMGLDQTQYVVIRHHDQPHPHFHLIANRVDNAGKTISDSHNYARSQALLKELSLQHGLTPVAERRAPKQRPERLLGADLTRHQLRQAVGQGLQVCSSGQAFKAAMQAQGITYQFRQNSTGQAVGVSFGKDGHTFKGSELDRGYSLAGINRQLKANHDRLQQQRALQPAPPEKPKEIPRPVAPPQVAKASTPPPSAEKAPELPAVERKWQEAYKDYTERINAQNAQIRANNRWIDQAAAHLAKHPTLKVAQDLKNQCPDYGLEQALAKQIKARESYQFRQEWIAEQRAQLTRQASSWLGLSREAREAKEKLAYLDNPQGSGLGRQMEEKHYTFWLRAQEGQKPEPPLRIVAKDHRKAEQPVLSLTDYDQRREVAERQAQAQQEQLKQRQNRGPKLGR